MTNTNNNSNPSLKAFLFAVAAICFAPFVSALPSTASTNLQTSPGVSIQTSGTSLLFTAPDKAVLNWGAFGSGADAIGLADTIAFNLPNASSSILNVVNGGANTTINGTLTSNAKVYILNPNGIIIGNGGRIEVANLVLSTVDSPFASQFQFAATGRLPSEDGNRTANGNITVNGTAIFTGSNVTFLTKDIALNGGLFNADLTVNADGAATIGSANNTFYGSGIVVINNPTGSTTIGAANGMTGANTSISVNSTSGSITNNVGASVSSRKVALSTETGDINVVGIGAPTVSVVGKNITLGLGSGANITVAANAINNIAIAGSNAFTIDGLKNTSGNTAVTSGGKLTLGNVHIDSNGATSFTGTSVSDSKDNVFVYGATSFTATAGDVSIIKAGHSFGPVSASATSAITVYEAGATNLNSVRAKEAAFKTGEFFFQTPLTSTATLEKLNLTAGGNVSFLNGNISNGLTISSGGDVDLSRLSLTLNLNNVAPIVTAKGTTTPPAP